MFGPKAVEGWMCEKKERKEEERKREWFGQFECEGVLGAAGAWNVGTFLSVGADGQDTVNSL